MPSRSAAHACARARRRHVPAPPARQDFDSPALAGDEPPSVRVCASGHFTASWTRDLYDDADDFGGYDDDFCPCEECVAQRQEYMDVDDDDDEEEEAEDDDEDDEE
jgi:hypothetical protein